MISFVLSRRCCNEGQVRVCSMSVTLLVLWYLLQAYLAARRWTISILLQCSAVWGFQTEHAYSSFGRTRDRYACDFILVLEVLRFLFKNPRLLFALATMLLACCVHFKSDWRVIPRYFPEDTGLIFSNNLISTTQLNIWNHLDLYCLL